MWFTARMRLLIPAPKPVSRSASRRGARKAERLSGVILRRCRNVFLSIIIAAALGLVLIPRGAAAAEPDLAKLVAAAQRGEAAAQFDLARRYDRAGGARQDQARALDLYCKAARQGHAPAALGIGMIFFNGRGVVADSAIAAAWFRFAAERGDALAARLARHFDTRPAPLAGCSDVRPYAGDAPRDIAAPPRDVAALVSTMAPRYGLDPKLVLAIIATESAFLVDAVSPRLAGGLMQLMPDTAARFGVERIFDPADNIRGGMMYLRWLFDHFGDNLELVLAAYNAGEGAIERYGGIPPYPETKAYVEKIRHLYASSLMRG